MRPRVWIKFEGQKLSVSAVAMRIGVTSVGLWDRLHRGVPREELLKPGYGPRRAFQDPLSALPTPEEYLAAEGYPLQPGQKPIGYRKP